MISLYKLTHPTVSGQWRSACLAAFDDAASPLEHARLKRLRRDEDRLAYRLNHGFLRLVLAGEAGCAPGAIAFTTSPRDKPVCLNGLYFNMSHTGNLTVVAVSRETDVGVDVETLVPGQGPNGSVPMAVADEDLYVLPLLSGVCGHAETILWSIKEAALKLTGYVMVEPDHVAVRPLRNGSFRVGTARAATAPIHEAFVHLVRLDEEHVLALATYEPVPDSQVVVIPESWYGPPGPDISLLSTHATRPDLDSRLLHFETSHLC
ncbi:4'-phosphopantetheinyl transferase family protein [Microvirga sp. 2TAF3]|uniref:4'-phosphopantetheinyl transferase family protein n=1 Tax=Microvirga sp. 2TAF3 TaxID=3233014 RepID=UPI003F9B1034